VPHPEKFEQIDYAQMLALAYSGSKVLHPRAVEFGYCYNLVVQIKSSFKISEGTTVLNMGTVHPPKELIMEDRKVSAIAHKDRLNCYVINRDAHEVLKNWIHEIFKYQVEDELLKLYIESKYDKEICHLLAQNSVALVEKQESLGFVNLVGIGINLDLSFLAKTLAITEQFCPRQIHQSDQTIEILIASEHVADCVQALHSALFGGVK
jgi:aspartokinase